jgi:hypothetical protein
MGALAVSLYGAGQQQEGIMNQQENRKAAKVTAKDLTGIALDWAVATCEGYILTTDGISHLVKKDGNLSILGPATSGGKPCGYSPSSYWAQGGPILDREGIDIHQVKHRPFHTYAYSESTKSRYPDGEVSTTPGGTPIHQGSTYSRPE